MAEVRLLINRPHAQEVGLLSMGFIDSRNLSATTINKSVTQLHLVVYNKDGNQCPCPDVWSFAVLLTKGFEIEVYTGTPEGDIVGMANKIAADLDGYMTEPDSRNVEYATDPFRDYDRLLCALLQPRRKLREYLNKNGGYTLIPGSTLSLGGHREFHRSDPSHPYHTFIEQTYGTKVVTASVHINIGIADSEMLIKACRLVRMEAPLY